MSRVVGVVFGKDEPEEKAAEKAPEPEEKAKPEQEKAKKTKE